MLIQPHCTGKSRPRDTTQGYWPLTYSSVLETFVAVADGCRPTGRCDFAATFRDGESTCGWLSQQCIQANNATPTYPSMLCLASMRLDLHYSRSDNISCISFFLKTYLTAAPLLCRKPSLIFLTCASTLYLEFSHCVITSRRVRVSRLTPI